MFAQTTGRTANPWTISASIAVQITVITAAILVPLWHVEALPSIQLAPKVTPPHVMLVKVPESFREPIRAVAPVLSTRVAPRPLQVPTHVPERVETLIDPPEAFIEAAATSARGLGLPVAPFETAIVVAAPPVPQPANRTQQTTIALDKTYRVGGDVKAPVLRSAPKPVYPPLARQARVQGTVRLNGVISRDGTVRSLELISGHPLLINAAIAAVRQWLYDPARLNGQPVDVLLVIDVNFTLSQ